jgi:HD superfamily phosphohydrolase
MKINDLIYGPEEIKESLLLELINSSSVQRLKDISQSGIPFKYHYKKGYSRYDHSLGVLVLLRKLKAPLEEQVAGLLHDVSHTVFSHVIDLVFGDPSKENYQDQIHLNRIKNSEIPKILEKYGLDYIKVSRIEEFPLLEKESPRLCADRIDYCLRELGLEKGFELSNKIFKNLIVRRNQICFKNRKFAEIFAENYIYLQNNSWASDQTRARYYLLSTILKRGLEIKLISLEDFHKTETYVLNLLENSKDDIISENLNLLKKGFKIINYENGVLLEKKFRFIDPEILFNNSFKTLSEISEEYAELIIQEKEKSLIAKKINIISN